RRGCFNADPLDTTYEETLKQEATGRAVGAVQVASVLSELRAAPPGLTLPMTALPATDDPDATRSPAAGSAAYALNPRPSHRKEARWRTGPLWPQPRHKTPRGSPRFHRLPGLRSRTAPVQPLRRHPPRHPEPLLHRRLRDQGSRGAAEGRNYRSLHGSALAELRRSANTFRPGQSSLLRNHGHWRGLVRSRQGLSRATLTQA